MQSAVGLMGGSVDGGRRGSCSRTVQGGSGSGLRAAYSRCWPLLAFRVPSTHNLEQPHLTSSWVALSPSTMSVMAWPGVDDKCGRQWDCTLCHSVLFELTGSMQRVLHTTSVGPNSNGCLQALVLQLEAVARWVPHTLRGRQRRTLMQSSGFL